ncbi:MAG: hypothetical protein WC748_08140 [Legionellales bacterium]|jgi:hypothetical protein
MFRLKYGPGFVDDDNVDLIKHNAYAPLIRWNRKKHQLEDDTGKLSWNKQENKLFNCKGEVVAHEDSVMPPVQTLDLNHLANQAFAKNTASLKRWFLTACVAVEDRHLINLPDTMSVETIKIITDQLHEINALLNQDVANMADSLVLLKNKADVLFDTENWIPVALGMVDDGTLDIDILNSLLGWQGIWHQFGSECITFKIASEEMPLRPIFKDVLNYSADGYPYFPTEGSKLHDMIFSEAILSSDLEFDGPEDNRCMFTYKTAENTICQTPSTVLEKKYFHAQGSYVVMIYAFGRLLAEDLNAAGYLGARLKQAYLPNAHGNLFFAHESYMGPGLAPQHDDIHAYTYTFTTHHNIKNFLDYMQVKAIVVNMFTELGRTATTTLAKERYNNIATSLIEFPHQYAFYPWFQAYGFINFLPFIYAELAKTTGVSMQNFSWEASGEEYKIIASFNGQEKGFNGMVRNCYTDVEACPLNPQGTWLLLAAHLQEIKNLAKEANTKYLLCMGDKKAASKEEKMEAGIGLEKLSL